MRYPILFLICIFCCEKAVGQTDSFPPTMKSDRLVTLEDFKIDATFGKNYSKLSQKTGSKSFLTRRGAKFILPTLFMAYGTAARFRQLPIRQFDFDIDHEIRKYNPVTAAYYKTYPIDNYLQIATPILAYGLGVIPGIEAKHNLRDRTIVMATSYLAMEGIVYSLKRIYPVMRPRGWTDEPLHSFPSGHMAVAMTAAHIMYKEYKDISPWIGVGGYLMASTTGAFRMINYAHWMSDVVMSAGIGLLCAEIGYMMLPVWHSLFGIEDKYVQVAAMPVFTDRSVGLGLVYQF
ncbi:MAG: phosphatase PAP2 family protein [Tannerella sp.]|jgi:membrane-associated phospholipid phosphatase|nr:phosphatase PAP2 family protein [Tannerella sp.]